MEPKIKGKAFNYNDTRDRKFYDVFVWMFHPLAKIIFKTQYIGRENVPKTGSLIIASNHRNSYDPGLIAAARVRKIHYMAKLELFNLNKLASWMLRHLNAFPVSRGTGDQRSLNYAIRLVEEGKVLGIFPEGTRSKDPDGKMLPLKDSSSKKHFPFAQTVLIFADYALAIQDVLDIVDAPVEKADKILYQGKKIPVLKD